MNGKWWRRGVAVVCGALWLVVLGPQWLLAGEVSHIPVENIEDEEFQQWQKGK